MTVDGLLLILDSKIFYQTEGKLVQVPGLPAMYDYEFFPQAVCHLSQRNLFRTNFEYLGPI